MKTLILAGGRGTRLGDLTKSVNKHLLPLGKWPLISYVFRSTVGISKHALLVTNPENISDFAQIVAGGGYPYTELDVYYTAQPKPEGIADAIRYGQYFCRRDSVLVMLGDNIFHPDDIESITKTCNNVKRQVRAQPRVKFGAYVWVTASDNPSAYGVIDIDDDGKVVSIEEKPENPASNLIITGVYLFDCQVWDIIPHLQKSDRGEYEITGILNAYLERGQLRYHLLEKEWFDVGGSVEGYWEVTERMRDIECTFWSPEQEGSSEVPS
jgi:glucose-1-phosphate thymidylyltransferase